MDSEAPKRLKADLENYIDACNKLRNTANAYFQTEIKGEDIKATNNFSEEYLKAKANYLEGLSIIGTGARVLRDNAVMKEMRQGIKQIEEALSVTAK